LSWTKEKPTIEGWYWIWFGTPTSIPYCDELHYLNYDRNRGLAEDGSLFDEDGPTTVNDHPRETMYYGPILPPEIPH
jgi:hypothetical protein